MRSYLQISPVLNLNAYFHLCLCCLFLYFDFFFELKKYIQCAYKPSENNDYYKETIKRKPLGIVHDYCDCHKTRIFTITCTCSQRLCGKLIQSLIYIESYICIPLLSAFLSNYPVISSIIFTLHDLPWFGWSNSLKRHSHTQYGLVTIIWI